MIVGEIYAGVTVLVPMPLLGRTFFIDNRMARLHGLSSMSNVCKMRSFVGAFASFGTLSRKNKDYISDAKVCPIVS